jgi:phenylalanyl-tRNA synthetase beta chain
MIVSWTWLKDYLPLDMPPEEVERRLAMAGLNHEASWRAADDLAIDFEVTSNRPDCLGHLGIAREIAVVFDKPFTIPDPRPKQGKTQVDDLTKVAIECPDLCYRYTARVIRGMKVGPTPDWMARRLRTIFDPRPVEREKKKQWKPWTSINNVVDITNYVLMECGQPLHAFDLKHLRGQQIIVRRARKGEKFEAINHETYDLQSEMCVIADAERAVALGGVMGGADTEVSNSTTDLLIESAEFAPLSIRNTARTLKLFSDSSYRFGRGVDPEGIDWASRRCCELILDLCGGELAEGVIDVGRETSPRPPITLRLSQIARVLGIEIDRDVVVRILTALGCASRVHGGSVEVAPPSWRRDLTREIDLIEEAARIHGYEKIPEDVSVPMAASHKSDADRVLQKIRRVLTAAGLDEALTASMVPQSWTAAFSPWTDSPPIVANTPMLKGADRLRTSLIPSLLDARRINESQSNPYADLFETAKAYLPRTGELPDEPWLAALVSGGDFYGVKGVIEAILAELNPDVQLEIADWRHPLLDESRSCELRLAGRRLGFLGELNPAGAKEFGLRGSATIAELQLAELHRVAHLIPTYRPLSTQQPITRDLNFIVAEEVRWSDLAATVRKAAGPDLERIEFREEFRDSKKDGPGRKRLLFSYTIRPAEKTLTSDEAEAIQQAIISACGKDHQATVVG